MKYEFKEIPRDLFRQVEPEAGEVLPALKGRLKPRRPVDEFVPDWSYLLTVKASKVAVVAGLENGWLGVPPHVWESVVRVHCPRAWKLLVDAQASFEQFQTGRVPAELGNAVAATANLELGGYMVFGVMDVPSIVAEIVGDLGALPTFE